MFPWLIGGAAGSVLGFMLFETAVATFACAVIVGFVFWAIARNHAASTRQHGSDSSGGGDFAWAEDGGTGHASSDCSSDGGGGDGGGGCD